MTNPAYEATNDVEKLIASIKVDIGKRKSMPQRGDANSNIERLRVMNDTMKSFSTESVEALISALNQARKDGEELTKFKEVMIQAANAVKDGNPIDLESMFKGELASAMFATMFAGEFVRHGAKNYLELLYAVPDFGDFTVTIQKKDGITPCERIAELDRKNCQLNTTMERWAIDRAESANRIDELEKTLRGTEESLIAAVDQIAELESAPNGMMQLSNELAEMKRKCVELTVWYGPMPESNGKTNWTAILHRKGESLSAGITIDRSEYPDRVRYEADRMRYLIGELDEKPWITNYDANKHSGYTARKETK